MYVLFSKYDALRCSLGHYDNHVISLILLTFFHLWAKNSVTNINDIHPPRVWRNESYVVFSLINAAYF